MYTLRRDLNYKTGDLVWEVADETAGKMDGDTFTAAKNNDKEIFLSKQLLQLSQNGMLILIVK